MRNSRVLKKMRNNEVALSTSVGFAASPKVTELVGLLGFDCIWIDMEHRSLDYEQVFNMIQGARAADTDCLVRVRKESYASYFRAFEDGAAGIMVPHCMSRDEAMMVVQNAKYPPIGMRGIDCVGIDADYGLAGQKEHQEHANRETFITVQVEDRETVECIDDIASVKGIDIIFVGPGDLMKSYGVQGRPKHIDILRAIEKVSNAADRNGIWWGLPVGCLEDAKEYVNMGAKFITVGSDRGILAKGYKEIFEQYGNLREETV